MELYYCKKKRPNNPSTNKTIVLDLDETLVKTCEDMVSLKNSKLLTNPDYYHVRSRLYNIYLEKSKPCLWGIKRAYLDEFLEFCFQYFKYVVVWSAGMNDYVHEICSIIFKDHPCPDAILTRDDCVYHRGKYTKPLEKVHDLFNIRKCNTIIVDDRDDIVENNSGYGIVIEPFDPHPRKFAETDTDDTLLKIKEWLENEHVVYTNDFIRVLDTNPFY